jgi:hypothetical protein
MKKIILIASLLLVYSCYSQPGVVAPRATTLPFEVPNGTYLKDINNEYLPYVGTWKAVKDNKEYTFVFQIFYQYLVSQPSGDYYYQDELKAKYEVKDIATGNILYTTMSAVNYDDFWVSALSTPDSDGRLDFYFCDKEHCYNAMTFSLMRITGSTTQLKYGIFNYYDWWNPEHCPAYPERTNVPVPIPKTWTTYIKQ